MIDDRMNIRNLMDSYKAWRTLVGCAESLGYSVTEVEQQYTVIQTKFLGYSNLVNSDYQGQYSYVFVDSIQDLQKVVESLAISQGKYLSRSMGVYSLNKVTPFPSGKNESKKSKVKSKKKTK